MADRGFQVRALGEIAIRCADMDTMEAFYRDVIGLEVLSHRDEGITFFKIADGHAGHTAVLALFSAQAGRPELHQVAQARPATGAGSSLHHLALSVGWEEQEAVMRWYDDLDQPYRVQHFAWIGWRGILTRDPEGNTVELVAADPEFPR
ncbi:MAG: VOC family protein [Hyphomicrobiaceae bacterium]